MGSLAEQIVEKFDLIEVDNTADLTAIGLAIYQIPEDLEATLSDKYTSLREEIIFSLCFNEDENSLNNSRLSKLKLCLDLAEVDLKDVDDPVSLNLLTFVKGIENASQAESRTRKFSSKNAKPKSDYEFLSVQHADTVLQQLDEMKVKFDESYVVDIVPDNLRLALGNQHAKNIIESLNAIGHECVKLYDDAFDKEMKIAKQYRYACEKIEDANSSQGDIDLCLNFANAVLEGKAPNEDLSKTQHAWLVDLAEDLEQLNKAIQAKETELDANLKEAFNTADNDLEMLQNELSELRAKTLEPPLDVIRSLNGTSEDSNDDQSMDLSQMEGDDYDQSLDFYLEWMQQQRILIKEKNAQVNALNETLKATEETIRETYRAEIEALQLSIDDKKKTLTNTLDILQKDSVDNDSFFENLREDAQDLFASLQVSMNERKNFASQFEDCLANITIQLGRILDDGSRLTYLSTITNEKDHDK
jgi:hypothetical protein